MPGGMLLQGEYDEKAAAASFQDAVREWREGRAASGAESANKEPVDPGAPLKVGDEVQMRDYDEQGWSFGVVTSVEPLEVQPRGKQKSFSFEQVKRYVPGG
eukprot:TRINITY_DN57169_c0_g1_i1.p1 TRINITY_DN57169_c0_g1~~TRINITY_DN57169_c0_g1_i1.p1  ORF type:complete len:101 (-),score=25.83 TRINITY_DN57169_c0_g1_i1:50-352(-)